MTSEQRSDVELGPEHGTHTHRDVSGGWLRPTVFGIMDGLVTNVSLIAGVGGGGAAPHTIVLTGLAGLVAGAFSMATGEYTSVRSQNELVGAEVELEATELRRHPVEEQHELARVFVRRGVEPALAEEVVRQMSRDPGTALQLHAQEELGVDPGSLPSPWVAAGSSLLSFAMGAIVPLVPYLAGLHLLWVAVAAGALALLVAGAAVARLTDRAVLGGALRQLLLGAFAIGVTYGIGHLIGATVGG